LAVDRDWSKTEWSLWHCGRWAASALWTSVGVAKR